MSRNLTEQRIPVTLSEQLKSTDTLLQNLITEKHPTSSLSQCKNSEEKEAEDFSKENLLGSSRMAREA